MQPMRPINRTVTADRLGTRIIDWSAAPRTLSEVHGHVMEAEAARCLLDALAASGVDPCVGGGWGVDALLGEQTRQHADLDLWILAAEFEHSISAFAETGIDRLYPWGLDGTATLPPWPAVFGPDGIECDPLNRTVEELIDFDCWLEAGCAHPWIQLADAHISNWGGYRGFQAALTQVGVELFPTLMEPGLTVTSV